MDCFRANGQLARRYNESGWRRSLPHTDSVKRKMRTLNGTERASRTFMPFMLTLERRGAFAGRRLRLLLCRSVPGTCARCGVVESRHIYDPCCSRVSTRICAWHLSDLADVHR